MKVKGLLLSGVAGLTALCLMVSVQPASAFTGADTTPGEWSGVNANDLHSSVKWVERLFDVDKVFFVQSSNSGLKKWRESKVAKSYVDSGYLKTIESRPTSCNIQLNSTSGVNLFLKDNHLTPLNVMILQLGLKNVRTTWVGKPSPAYYHDNTVPLYGELHTVYKLNKTGLVGKLSKYDSKHSLAQIKAAVRDFKPVSGRLSFKFRYTLTKQPGKHSNQWFLSQHDVECSPLTAQ